MIQVGNRYIHDDGTWSQVPDSVLFADEIDHTYDDDPLSFEEKQAWRRYGEITERMSELAKIGNEERSSEYIALQKELAAFEAEWM